MTTTSENKKTRRKRNRIIRANPELIEQDKKCILCDNNIVLKDSILRVKMKINGTKIEEYIHAICFCETNRGSLFELAQKYMEKKEDDNYLGSKQ